MYKFHKGIVLAVLCAVVFAVGSPTSVRASEYGDRPNSSQITYILELIRELQAKLAMLERTVPNTTTSSMTLSPEPGVWRDALVSVSNSENPTVTGTSQGIYPLRLSVQGEYGDKEYGSGDITPYPMAGTWTHKVAKDLRPGSYRAILYIDKNGKLEEVTHKVFTVSRDADDWTSQTVSLRISGVSTHSFIGAPFDTYELTIYPSAGYISTCVLSTIYENNTVKEELIFNTKIDPNNRNHFGRSYAPAVTKHGALTKVKVSCGTEKTSITDSIDVSITDSGKKATTRQLLNSRVIKEYPNVTDREALRLCYVTQATRQYYSTDVLECVWDEKTIKKIDFLKG